MSEIPCDFCYVEPGDFPSHIVCDLCRDILKRHHEKSGCSECDCVSCKLLRGLDRLSPATRKLLIERPEAVELCVAAIQKYAAYQRMPNDFAIDRAWDLVKAFNRFTKAAIAALPEETP